MARQIFKQPNGLYAEYSTIVDAFVLLDATREELIANTEYEAARDARERLERVLIMVDAGITAGAFAISFEEAVHNHNKSAPPRDRIELNPTLEHPPRFGGGSAPSGCSVSDGSEKR